MDCHLDHTEYAMHYNLCISVIVQAELALLVPVLSY